MEFDETSQQQADVRGQSRMPRTSVQDMDMERQASAMGSMGMPPAQFRQQSRSPRTQPWTQQQEVMERSMSISPGQQFSDARRQSSPFQPGIMPNMQDGRLPSPIKRASFDPQLEASPASEERRYPSPMKRKTLVVHPASFDIASRPQMVPSQQEVAALRKSVMEQQGQYQPVSPRKSMVQQEISQQSMLSPRKSMFQQPLSPPQPVSPRKSMFQQPLSSPQPVSPRKSVVQQQMLHQSTLSPRKSMFQEPLSPTKGAQGNVARTVSMYREQSAPLSQQENLPASSSYVNQRSMSSSPTAQMRYDVEDAFDNNDDEDDAYVDDGGGGGDDGDGYNAGGGDGGGYNSQDIPVSRSTSMSPLAPPTVRFQDDQSVLMPAISNSHMVNRSATLEKTAQVTAEANMHPRMSISPRLMQTQQSTSPARIQSSIGRSKSLSPSQMSLEQQRQSVVSRSMSMSPTQMNMEQQRQPRSSSANLASVQGARPETPPQLNRYLSTAAPRVSVVTPNRTSNIFQPSQLLPVPSSKRMQLGRASLEHGTASSSVSRVPTKHEWHLSVTDVVLRSMAAIASAVAFCVMITNTVWINNQTVSYSNFAGFRYVAGISATAFVISILQLGVIVSKKLRSYNLGIDIEPTRPCLFSSMFVDQVLSYLLLSAGSVGVGALVYLPSICKSATEISAEFCSRSTLSVVLTLVVSTIFVMSAILSTFRFYQKPLRYL